MRKIKFRGRSCALDDYVYGFAYQGCRGKWWIYPDWDMPNEAVYMGSVAQLVGVDKNGEEIYEGDVLLDKDDNEYEAILQCPFDTGDKILKRDKPPEKKVTVQMVFKGRPVPVKKEDGR